MRATQYLWCSSFHISCTVSQPRLPPHQNHRTHDVPTSTIASPPRRSRRRRASTPINNLPLPVDLLLSRPRIHLPPRWRRLNRQRAPLRLKIPRLDDRDGRHVAVFILHVLRSSASRFADIIGETDEAGDIVLWGARSVIDFQEEGKGEGGAKLT